MNRYKEAKSGVGVGVGGGGGERSEDKIEKTY